MANSGVVKLYNPDKGFGFITSEEHGDVFVHAKACEGGGIPAKGDVVTFDLEDSAMKPGQKQAANIKGCTGVGPGVIGSGANRGTIKSFSQLKGWGFVEHNGQDIFVHIKDCQGGMPQKGDTVAFDLEESSVKQGAMKASNITGGTAPMDGGKGKGMDGKGGGKDGWGKGKDPWGGGFDPWAAGPYGAWGGGDPWGGGGDPWGKGKGGDPWGADPWGKGGGGGWGKDGGKGGWGGDPWGKAGGKDAGKGWGGDAAWGKGKW